MLTDSRSSSGKRVLSVALLCLITGSSSLCLFRPSLPLAQGMKILLNLDDWLICAPSWVQSTRYTALLPSQMDRLGLKLNLERSLTLICVALDTGTTRACPSAQSVDSILHLLLLFRGGRALPNILFLCLLGKMTATSAVVPLGLLLPPAKMAERPFGRQVAQVQEGQGVTAVPPRSIPMEREGISVRMRTHGLSSIPQRDCHNRCHPLWMGCRMAEQDLSGSVGCSEPYRARKCARSAGCTPSPQAFPVIPEGEACACMFGTPVCHENHQGGMKLLDIPLVLASLSAR